MFLSREGRNEGEEDVEGPRPRIPGSRLTHAKQKSPIAA